MSIIIVLVKIGDVLKNIKMSGGKDSFFSFIVRVVVILNIS